MEYGTLRTNILLALCANPAHGDDAPHALVRRADAIDVAYGARQQPKPVHNDVTKMVARDGLLDRVVRRDGEEPSPTTQRAVKATSQALYAGLAAGDPDATAVQLEEASDTHKEAARLWDLYASTTGDEDAAAIASVHNTQSIAFYNRYHALAYEPDATDDSVYRPEDRERVRYLRNNLTLWALGKTALDPEVANAHIIELDTLLQQFDL